MKRDVIKQADMLQNITIEEIELLKQLLWKANSIYGERFKNKLTDHEEDCLYTTFKSVDDYLLDNQ